MSEQSDCICEPSLTPPSLRRLWPYAVVVTALILLAGALLVMPESAMRAALGENGPIEILSAAGYFLVTAVFALGLRKRALIEWYFPVIFVAMGLRELDFHVRFTTVNMSKARYFFTEGVPLGEKAIVALCLTVLGIAVLVMVIKHAGDFWRSLKKWRTPGVGCALVMVFVLMSTVLDALPRKMVKWNVTISPELKRFLSISEEVVELGIPLVILIAVMTVVRSANVVKD